MQILKGMGDPWSPVDPLGEALHLLRMNGVFYCRSEFTAPWALALPPFEACMMFHVVTAGQCWLEVEGANSCHLRPGDLALVPHGEGHRLVGAAGVTAVKLFDAPRELVSDRYEILRHGGGGDSTTVICGVVRFDHPAAHHLIRREPINGSLTAPTRLEEMCCLGQSETAAGSKLPNFPSLQRLRRIGRHAVKRRPFRHFEKCSNRAPRNPRHPKDCASV